jgi:hypothetical protein
MPGIAHVGFDFGSSLIKVAVRLEDVGESGMGADAAFGMAFRGTDRERPYEVFRPTAIHVGNGSIYLRDPPDDARRIGGIKERLMGAHHPQGEPLLDAALEDSGLTLHEAAALLLASAMSDVRMAIAAYVADRQTLYPETVLVNCAVPSSDTMSAQTRDALSETACPHRRGFQKLVERVRRAAFAPGAVPIPGRLTIGDARDVARRIIGMPLPTDLGDWGTSCIPEALAAVVAAGRHPQFRQGLFMVFDIGAYTTDASLFHFHPGQDYRIMVYYGIGSSRAGIGSDRTSLPSHDLACLRGRLQDMYAAMLEAMIVEHGDEFRRQMLRDHPRPNSPKWIPVVLGGGATFPEIRQAVGGLSLPSRHEGAYRVTPMGRQPATFPTETFSHVVFIRRASGRKTETTAALRQGPARPRFVDAIERPSHILQLAMGLASSVFNVPTWSAAEPVVADRRPASIPSESWQQFHPWTGL